MFDDKFGKFKPLGFKISSLIIININDFKLLRWKKEIDSNKPAAEAFTTITAMHLINILRSELSEYKTHTATRVSGIEAPISDMI